MEMFELFVNLIEFDCREFFMSGFFYVNLNDCCLMLILFVELKVVVLSFDVNEIFECVDECERF